MGNKNLKYERKKGVSKAGRMLLIYSMVFFILLTPIGVVHGASAAISLSQYSGPPGITIWINGTGFSTNTNVNIYWDNSYQDTVTTDSNGNFSYQYTIPSSTAGTHTITADDGSNTASATFTVVPEITLSPNNGYVNTSVTVDGEGFSGNVRVYLFWDSTYLGRTTTNNNGAFTFVFNVPASPYGLHTVKAIDTDDNQATASFLVLSHITLSTSTGYYGKQISYDCTGYSANARLFIVWDYGTSNSVLLDTETTDSTGSYSGSFRIPQAAYGAHDVTGIDEFSHSDTTSFSVTPKVEITPGTGIVGSMATVKGYGFSANSLVDINWTNGAVLNSTVTNAIGSFSANITIPYAVVGNHIVTVTDSNSVQGSAVYDVTPHIVISPDYGLSGSTSSVTCTGFSGSANINIYWDFGLPTEVTLSSATTNSTGTCVVSVNIPSGSNTTHTVAGVDANNYIAQTYYYLGPHIYLSPNNGFVGSNVTVNGTSFSANSTVEIYWDGEYVASTTTNSSGVFSGVFTVPHSVYGYHTVSAVDADGNSSSAKYMVLAHIYLSSHSGTVFDNITIIGTGFSGSSVAYVYWDSANTQRSMLTNTTGDFIMSFEIPESTAGTHSIYSKDINGVISDIQNYAISPLIKLHPDYGHIGNTYSIYCYGFGATVTLNMLWDGSSEPYFSTTNSVGTGIINAIVPNAAAGVHSIEVYDSLLNMAPVVNFTVLSPDSPIALSPIRYVNTTAPTLTWTSENNTANYTLEYGIDPTFSNFTVVTGITSPHYTLSGLSNGVTYYWRVCAVDVHGNSGDYSNILSFTVDITPPTSSASVKAIYTNNTHILVNYNASDSISGVHKVALYYSYEGSDYQEYAVSNLSRGVFDFYAPHGDGNYSFYTVAYDWAGNIQVEHRGCYVVLDTAPPVAILGSLPQYSQSKTLNLTFTATDSGVGVAYVNIYWSTDGITWNYYGRYNISTANFVFPHDGTYYFKGIAVDNAGNVQVTTPVIVSTTADTTPPMAGINVNGTMGENSWYISSVTVTLHASDAMSGVDAIYYSINGSAYSLYTGPVTIGRDGTYSISYYAVDYAGNIAPTQQSVVKIDRTAPSLAIIAPQVNEVLNGTATLIVNANDTHIAGVYFRIDNGPWTLLSENEMLWKASFDTDRYSDGEHTVIVKAIDDARNYKTSSEKVLFNNIRPKLIGVSVPSGLASGNVKVIIEALDAVGIKNVQCKISTSGFNKSYSMSRDSIGNYYLDLNTTTLKDGEYVLIITAENEGGKTTVITSHFTVDNTPPVVKHLGSCDISGIATLSFDVKDATSGVKNAWISIDNGKWTSVPVKNGIVEYTWNTMLIYNGVHHVQLKVIDNAGNEVVYEKDVYVNNLNIMPMVYIVVLVVIVILLLFLFRKKEKKENMNSSKEKSEDMILPNLENTKENADLKSKSESIDIDLGGDLNE